MEADGIGPGYCKSCKRKRKSSAVCQACPEPQLLPQNVKAVEAYQLCLSQWNYGGMGVRTGLNYAGIEAGLRLSGFNATTDLFSRIQVIESAVLTIDSETRTHGNKN